MNEIYLGQFQKYLYFFYVRYLSNISENKWNSSRTTSLKNQL